MAPGIGLLLRRALVGSACSKFGVLDAHDSMNGSGRHENLPSLTGRILANIRFSIGQNIRQVRKADMIHNDCALAMQIDA